MHTFSVPFTKSSELAEQNNKRSFVKITQHMSSVVLGAIKAKRQVVHSGNRREGEILLAVSTRFEKGRGNRVMAAVKKRSPRLVVESLPNQNTSKTPWEKYSQGLYVGSKGLLYKTQTPIDVDEILVVCCCGLLSFPNAKEK